MDDIDTMLQGQGDPSPESQSESQDQSIDSNQNNSLEQQSPEEVEFNKLPGSTRDRITKLVRDKREMSEELARYRANTQTTNGNQQTQTYSNDPLQTLSNAGVALKQDVEQGLASMRYEFEMNRLESKFTGGNGEPQFSRSEYEEYVQSHPEYRNYLPEDVFKMKMFSTEFSNLDRTRTTSTGQTSTLRPTGTQTRQETLTPEYIEQRLKETDGEEWYLANFDKINGALSKMGSN